LYTLPAGTFISLATMWEEEVVSTEAVPVREETRVPDVEAFLLDLANRGRLWIARFPGRVPCLPADERDYVRKLAGFIRAGGRSERMARQVLFIHRPDLLERVERILGFRL